MNSPQLESQNPSGKPGAAAQSWVITAVIAVGVVCVGIVVLPRLLRSSTGAGADESPSLPSQAEAATPIESEKLRPTAVVVSANAPTLEPVVAPPPAPVRRSQATAETRQMVEGLTRPVQPGTPLSAEQAAAWKQQWQQLVAQGAGGLPAIRDFLEKNQDVMFDADSARMLGYPSARVALFDALREMGGPDGIAGTLEALHGTGDPGEILALARNLESMAPGGEHRQEVAQAAREALDMAAHGDLKGYDVGPLFQVLQQAGGVDSVAEFEKASGQWNYYSTMALASLPDGAGIPSLIRMAQGTSGARTIAFEMLAQTATQYPEARAALVDMARREGIPPTTWAYLGSVLGGDQYQFADAVWQAAQDGHRVVRMKTGSIRHGNQGFYQGPPIGGFTPEQINQQTALIDEMLGATSNARAVQSLQTARNSLSTRLAGITQPAPLP